MAVVVFGCKSLQYIVALVYIAESQEIFQYFILFTSVGNKVRFEVHIVEGQNVTLLVSIVLS